MFHGRSPYEVLFQRMPQYSFLKPFGCACFPYFVATFANKLQPLSIECIFLGYAPHNKGYRCLHPRSGRVYISKNVQFHEAAFPHPTLITSALHSTHVYRFDPRDVLCLTPTCPFVVLTEIPDHAPAHPRGCAPVTDVGSTCQSTRDVSCLDLGP